MCFFSPNIIISVVRFETVTNNEKILNCFRCIKCPVSSSVVKVL